MGLPRRFFVGRLSCGLFVLFAGIELSAHLFLNVYNMDILVLDIDSICVVYHSTIVICCSI